MAHLQDPPPEVQIHLRPVLPEKSHQPGIVRLLRAGEDRRCQPDSQVEEDGLRESMLLAVHSDEGHELWHQLHLPGPEGKTGGGQGGRVCALRVPRMFRMSSLDRSD